MRSLLIPALAFLSLLQSDKVERKPRYGIGVVMWASDASSPSCPIFVGGIAAHSPAARAGIHLGDMLLSIDGQPVHAFSDVMEHLSLTAVPSQVTTQFARGDTIYTATMEREDYAQLLEANGLKEVDGLQVDLNATDADVKNQLDDQQALEKAMRSGDNRTIFTDRHYPEDKTLYYPGFEVFVWNHGTEITVGGIEDGPARRSGIRWGDHILFVNGIDPHGKSDAELAGLLSSHTPRSVVLVVTRGGVQRTYSFDLERADRVLSDNHLQVAQGKIVPAWAPAKYLPCFEAN